VSIIPNPDRAVIPQDKLRGYLLNENHPEQPGHAVLFRRLLGISILNEDRLRAALLAAVRTEPAILGEGSVYGTKYEVRFPMTGPRGTYTVLSVWMVAEGTDFPRLVTAFIE
jgi:hypothetical protein